MFLLLTDSYIRNLRVSQKKFSVRTDQVPFLSRLCPIMVSEQEILPNILLVLNRSE